MTIWIVRKHPLFPYNGGGWMEQFTIHSTHANRKEAKEVADKKNGSKTTNYLYTVGRVSLRVES